MKFLLLQICFYFFLIFNLSNAETYSSILNGQSVVPSINVPGKGIATFEYNTGSLTVSWSLSWTQVDRAVLGCYIFGPATIGRNAPAIIHLTEVETYDGPPLNFVVNADGSASGKFEMTAQEAVWFEGGELYISINTTSHTNGEIRGQILPPGDSFTIALSGKNEVPPNNSTAAGEASFDFIESTKQLRYQITHSIAAPTGAHIHGPASESENADVLIPFRSATSPMSDIIQLTDEHIQMLRDGKLYVNIHSQAFPDGEIRAQIQQSSNGSDGLSTGAIVAIVISTIVGVILIVVLVFFGVKYYKKKKHSKSDPQLLNETPYTSL
eukprot:TRINITY_DN1265_c2_g2_i2.p1 TRINITY_DN1265_c2_g2~~TRINITY_DN1265_c2_g2_i2.p1  ORF type:complete len:325 (-),score=163.31 TRINITY_DN1265_c2_g2_i2:173-1147(-)